MKWRTAPQTSTSDNTVIIPSFGWLLVCNQLSTLLVTKINFTVQLRENRQLYL